jgi:hypothetical protein
METVIQRIRARREKLAAVLRDEEYSGIRKIVEDLYPDKAHFLYELLQNAEDAGATVVQFKLDRNSLTVIHDGRPFSERDIEAITNIGLGTKGADEDKIGRFGIGFKAVFAYCETPIIFSAPHYFHITELVLPEELSVSESSRTAIGQQTVFAFPFNSTKKAKEAAYAEVKTGLAELLPTTLLFLRNISAIRWTVDGGPEEAIVRTIIDERREADGLEMAIVTLDRGGARQGHRFLRVLEPAAGASRLSIGIAYELQDAMADTDALERKGTHPLRIVPALGRVHVYFPAKKETSGLRFHVNAPFVPELSRASIKDIPANDTLILQIASLAKRSLHVIKDKGLLSTEFLGVLPNPADEVSRYAPIREAIIEEMNEEPLTPTYGKGHAAAKRLLQARASLKALLSEADLEFLVDYEDEPPLWAVGATQKNSDQDRFLGGLAITEWDIDEFVAKLRDKIGWGYEFAKRTNNQVGIAKGDECLAWLTTKSLEWHQQLYASLFRELDGDAGQFARLRDLPLIKTSEGRYRPPDECYLPSAGVEQDETLPRVVRDVFSSGKSKQQQDAARQFLLAVGVREVGEAEELEALLLRNYSAESLKPDLRDLSRMVGFLERNPVQATMFQDFHIFERVDGKWGQPSQVYLDAPFLETDLSAYFESLGELAPKRLSDNYRQCGISNEKLLRFAELVGVRSGLVIEHRSTHRHPASGDLRKDYYGYKVRMTDSSVDTDWWIPELDRLLAQPTVELSRLLWRTMDKAPVNVLIAQFRPNRQYPIRQQASSLVFLLKVTPWIPQAGGSFVVPTEASSNGLPPGFPFDAGKEWLKAINFGQEETAKSEQHQIAMKVAERLGFRDVESLERARRFAELPEDEQDRILAKLDTTDASDEDERHPDYSERRREKIREAAMNAPDRGSELKLRSVAERRDGIKEGADSYLRQYYTRDSIMFCQIGSHALPFKLPGGEEYYYEAVEILTRKETSKHHKQNYLCLCPDHAAMFRFANPNRLKMRAIVSKATGSTIRLPLAGRLLDLDFHARHLGDLRTILEVDEGPGGDRHGD